MMETLIVLYYLYFHKNTLTSRLYLLTEKCLVLREPLSIVKKCKTTVTRKINILNLI